MDLALSHFYRALKQPRSRFSTTSLRHAIAAMLIGLATLEQLLLQFKTWVQGVRISALWCSVS